MPLIAFDFDPTSVGIHYILDDAETESLSDLFGSEKGVEDLVADFVIYTLAGVDEFYDNIIFSAVCSDRQHPAPRHRLKSI